MSAAAQITILLLFFILSPLLAVVAGVMGWLYWRERRERAWMDKVERQAELYARLSGAAAPVPRLRRQPAQPAPSGNVFIVGSGEQRDADWRLLQ